MTIYAGLSIYQMRYTEKVREGIWHAHDDFEFKGYGPFVEGVINFVCASPDMADLLWQRFVKQASLDNKPVLVSSTNLGAARIVLEL